MISFFSDEKTATKQFKIQIWHWDGFHSGNMRPSYNSIPLSTESSSSPYDSDVTLPILQDSDPDSDTGRRPCKQDTISPYEVIC